MIKLYAPDNSLSSNCHLLAQHSPIVSGLDAIRAWYENCFQAITLDVVFDIKEIVLVSDEFAFATTTSQGTQKNNASGAVTREGNHELFVVQKVDEEWKLARYCFSTTNPPV